MKPNIQNLFDKFSQKENDFFLAKQEFFSPVVQGQLVRVKLDGIIMSFKVLVHQSNDYYVLRPVNYKEAEIVRVANMMEREEYLKLFKRFTAVIYRQGQKPKGFIHEGRSGNYTINGPVEILLAQNISMFDVVDIRWDGQSFWYEGLSSRINPAQNTLQEALSNKLDPKNLSTPGLFPAEREAYTLAFEDVKDKVEDRLNKALLRSGGKLIKYVDRGEAYTVTYKVRLDNGTEQEVTSTMNADNLQIQSAGICLSGGDSNFDLQTLVNVIREGGRRRRIVVGDFSNYPGGARQYNEDDDYDEDY